VLTDSDALSAVGFDAVALKPTECDVGQARALDVDTVTIDYEGREHLPESATLQALAAKKTVRLTVPVRADGFDPLGDDARSRAVPAGVGRVFVAGHSAYLTSEERRRAVAPRLRAARERFPDAWVGTEGIARTALAVGGTQFELLSRTTENDLRALRAAGFAGEVAVYAPVVLTDDEDTILDAVGEYVARRGPVAHALPQATAATDATATGRVREVLRSASRDYALVGTTTTVSKRIETLREAGADLVVGYPARSAALDG
jgi:hypothetical protein